MLPRHTKRTATFSAIVYAPQRGAIFCVFWRDRAIVCIPWTGGKQAALLRLSAFGVQTLFLLPVRN
jgi:hypothetical protein